MDTELRKFNHSSFHGLNNSVVSACCRPGPVLGGRGILIFVSQGVAIGYRAALAISFHVCHGGSCNIWTTEWGKSEVIPGQRRLPGSWGLKGLVSCSQVAYSGIELGFWVISIKEA